MKRYSKYYHDNINTTKKYLQLAIELLKTRPLAGVMWLLDEAQNTFPSMEWVRILKFQPLELPPNYLETIDDFERVINYLEKVLINEVRLAIPKTQSNIQKLYSQSFEQCMNMRNSNHCLG